MIDARIEELFAAVRAGDEASVLQMLEESPVLVDSYLAGVSPIRAAIYYGNRDLAAKIAERAVSLTIHDAAALGRNEQIKHLDGEANEFSEDGFTPLTLACAFGNKETVVSLLNMGADLELFSTNPNIKVAPIHAATFGGNSETVRTLLEAGADPNLRGEGGFTALHTAAQNADEATVDVLLAGGADITMLTDDGKSPKDFAIESEATALANKL